MWDEGTVARLDAEIQALQPQHAAAEHERKRLAFLLQEAAQRKQAAYHAWRDAQMAVHRRRWEEP